MRHRFGGTIVMLLGTFALAAAAPPVVATDSAPTGGRAASNGTLLQLTIGDSSVTLSADRSASRRGRDALATMVVGATDGTEVGRLHARTSAGPRRKTLGPGTLSLGTAGAFDVAASAVVAALGGNDRAVTRVTTSLVDATLATVGEVGVVNQDVSTLAANGQSRSRRTVQVADLTVLSLEQLLEALDLGLLAVPCAPIEAIAASLGAPPTDACDQLNSIQTQLASAFSILDLARGDAQALRDTTQPLANAQQTVVDALVAAVAELTDARTTLVADAAGLDRAALEATSGNLQAEISALQPLCTAQGLFCDLLTTLSEQLTQINNQLGTLDALDAVTTQLDTAEGELLDAQAALAAFDATLEGALTILDALEVADLGGQPTCADASAALTQAGTLIPSLATQTDPVRSALDDSCAELVDELETLLDTPLLSLSGVEVEMNARTAARKATSTVNATIGSVTVGALPPTATAVRIDDGPALEAATSEVASALDTVLSSLGFASSGLDVQLLRTDRSTRVHDDGATTAAAGLALLEVRAPAAQTTLPAAAPFGALADALPDAEGPGGTVSLPAFRLTLGSFSAASSFPASVVAVPPPPGGDGGVGLPTTGVGSRADVAALLFFAAYVVRRVARTQRSAPALAKRDRSRT